MNGSSRVLRGNKFSIPMLILKQPEKAGRFCFAWLDSGDYLRKPCWTVKSREPGRWCARCNWLGDSLAGKPKSLLHFQGARAILFSGQILEIRRHRRPKTFPPAPAPRQNSCVPIQCGNDCQEHQTNARGQSSSFVSQASPGELHQRGI